MTERLKRTVRTPVGLMLLVQEGEGLTRLRWSDALVSDDSELLDEAESQLEAYFAGTLAHFQLPLRYHCSDFQQSACEAMAQIPYGSTITYGEMARNLGSSAQAVGVACGGNPFPVIIPCHRVLAANGIGGYSGEGGIETKISLLKMEGGFPWLL